MSKITDSSELASELEHLVAGLSESGRRCCIVRYPRSLEG